MSDEDESEESMDAEKPEDAEDAEDAEDTGDLVDPQEKLRAKCRPDCQEHADKLELCNERVGAKTQTRETCMEELVDLLECVEHCVNEDLFSMLK